MFLKSQFLSGVRPFYAPDLDARAAAAAEREKIKVENIKKEPVKEEVKEEEKDEAETDTKSSDKKVIEDGKNDNEESDEEGEDEDDKKEEEKELTSDELKKQVETLTRDVKRLQRRQGKTVAERDQIRKDLATATASLNAKVAEGETVLTEEEVERRSELKAEAKATDREFKKAVQILVKGAVKIDKDFESKAQELANDIAPISSFMIAALEDLDNGAAVFAHLADNPDVYEEIFDLPPAKLTTRLSRLSIKLEDEAKPKLKKISKVPPPIDGIKGSEKSPTQLPSDPTKHMSEFVAMRTKQVADRRKAKFG